ncbi:hypothetical protein B0H10DRAFT_1940509 [Mycena sp. CBHHK59/15]|nr:hypothetical protein B0H10DRAFT_1940509 [Mycena sp. CBHHK59/15]
MSVTLMGCGFLYNILDDSVVAVWAGRDDTGIIGVLSHSDDVDGEYELHPGLAHVQDNVDAYRTRMVQTFGVSSPDIWLHLLQCLVPMWELSSEEELDFLLNQTSIAGSFEAIFAVQCPCAAALRTPKWRKTPQATPKGKGPLLLTSGCVEVNLVAVPTEPSFFFVFAQIMMHTLRTLLAQKYEFCWA